MKAMLMNKYGSPNVFIRKEIPLPRLKDHELLVKVYGSSVNPITRILYVATILKPKRR